MLSLPMAQFQAVSPLSLWMASCTFSLRIIYPLLHHHPAFPRIVHPLFSHRVPLILHLLISPLDPTIHHCVTVPSSKASFQQSGPHDLGRELAKSTGPGPEQRSWAAHAEIRPPQSGTGAPMFPGLQLEERRLEQEGGADRDTRDSKSRF